jgi:hypothetical protein
LTLYSKEKALELLPFYFGDSPYEQWIVLGWAMTIMCLLSGILMVAFAIPGHDKDRGGIIIGGWALGALGVVGFLGCCGGMRCRDRAKQRLENELMNGNQGPVVNQTLLKEDF